MELISNIFIGIFGCSAIYLVGRKDKWKRYGYVCGVLSQPFWLYTSINNEQWGIVFLSLFYCYAWSSGFYNYWIKKGSK